MPIWELRSGAMTTQLFLCQSPEGPMYRFFVSAVFCLLCQASMAQCLAPTAAAELARPEAALIRASVSMPRQPAVAETGADAKVALWHATPETLVLVALALMLGIALRRNSAGKQ